MSNIVKRLDAHFVACAGAAGAALVGATQKSQAAIVWSGPVSIPVPNNIDGVYLNVVTGATGSTGGAVAGWDINPYTAGTNTFNLWGFDTSTWLSTGGVIAGPYNLAPNTPIAPPPAGAYFRPGGGTDIGPQMNLNSSNNLLGYEFVNENGGGTHYGWVRFQFGATAGDRSIVEYAYDDVANTAIPAGAVPAPGPLALLALGAAGLMGRRRK